MFSKDSLKSNSLFESISLSSTIGGNHNPYQLPIKPNSSRLNPELESIPGSSTDEELDPAEFLSPESPELLTNGNYKSKDKLSSIGVEGDLPGHILKKNINSIAEKSLEPKVSSNESSSTATIRPSFNDDVKDINGDNNTNNSSNDDVNNNNNNDNDNNDIDDDDDEFNESMLYSLNLVMPSYPKHSSNNNGESPLRYLQEDYYKLTKNLENYTRLHKQALENGSDNLNKIRQTIGNILDQLSENQYSLHELYNKESTYNSTMSKRFKKWDNKRNKILKMIQSIKSEDNVFGKKLSKLLDESSSLDSEINDLELKLLSLKAKKKILVSEIKDTSSVLESKTSKYVKAFEELDKNGELAILETLRMNGVTEEQARELIHSTPVKVTFVDHYMNKQLENSSNSLINNNAIPDDNNKFRQKIKKDLSPPMKSNSTTSVSPVLSQSIASLSKPQTSHTMGMQAYEPPTSIINSNINTKMQAYVPPSDFQGTTNDSRRRSNSTSRSISRGPSNNPYEKGFDKGFEASEKVKQQLNQIYETYIKPLLEQKENYQARPILKVDDIANTINSKVDLIPILAFIEHKVEGYMELSNKTGLLSTVYHKYSTIWKDASRLITAREHELQSSMLLRKEGIEKSIGEILIASLEDLLNTLDIIVYNGRGNNPLFNLIENESSALLSALSMLPSPYNQKKIEYEQKIKDKYIDSPQIKQQSDLLMSTASTSIFNDSSSDFLYNVSANAIEHRVLKNDHKEPTHKITNKSSNGKLVKGE